MLSGTKAGVSLEGILLHVDERGCGAGRCLGLQELALPCVCYAGWTCRPRVLVSAGAEPRRGDLGVVEVQLPQGSVITLLLGG